jgi:hypothetical protein
MDEREEEALLRHWDAEAGLWEQELCFGDVEGTLWPEELAAVEAMFRVCWRDLPREELYAAAVWWFAKSVAAGVLGTNGSVPPGWFSLRVYGVLRGIGPGEGF